MLVLREERIVRHFPQCDSCSGDQKKKLNCERDMNARVVFDMEINGERITSCPVGIIKRIPIHKKLELDHVIRLSYAKMSGGLSPYPGTYTVRGLTLIDKGESEILALQRDIAEEEAEKHKVK